MRLHLFAPACAKLLAGLIALTMAAPVAAQSEDPIPLEFFAVRENMTNVQISPDGRHIALMRIPARTANPLIEIYQTDDLSAPPRRLNADPMEFQGLSWVTDDLIIVSARQQIRNRIDGFNRGVYAGKTVIYSLEEGEFEELVNFAIEGVLPSEPDEIIISVSRGPSSFSEDDPFAAFRPRAYYRFNVETGQRSLILNGNQRIAQATFDDQGNPRAAQGYDAGSREFVFYSRGIGDTQWSETYRIDGFDRSTFQPVAFDPEDEDLAYVLAHNGHDKLGFWEFDLAAGEFGELIYRREDSDISGIRFHSNFWGEGQALAGVNYYADRIRTAWIDPNEEALYAGLRQAIPNAHQLNITSRSRDGDRMIVFNQGPRDPGSYYLFADGQLRYLGGQAPQLDSERLSDVEYIQYPSRHGDLTIPAYVTIPTEGEAPYPLVVLPHGGPYVSEVITYDEWGQVLASRGYMVLQPQYRGSLGYGLNHWTSAFSQSGYAMQDDKDDGALYLVEQGLVDPDRIAMFGWSYGGYAALVAASREDNIYQCAIAGAAVADPTMQLNYYRDGLLPFQEEIELLRREGIQPIDEVENINIPLMLIHGDVDQRVPLEHMEVYIPRLERAGIPFEYVELEGADHFYNTLFYRHQIELYTELLGFLEEDCGPGGL